MFIFLRFEVLRYSLSPAFVSDIELGRRHPSGESLVNIVKALGVSTEVLRVHDSWPPIEAIKQRAEADPLFSRALRTIIDTKITGHQLLQLLEDQKGQKSRKRSR